MNLETIVTVGNENLERLSPQEAVDFFRELLWAEARKIGIGIDKIHVSSWINVPDGGIDALVDENIASAQSDIIKPGRTGYQIKTGEMIKPWEDAQIKKELFGGKDPSKENLGSSVKGCLDNDGTYILVCFKQDPTEEQHSKAVNFLKGYFEQCGYQNPNVEVWGQNNLIGFLTVFPSLALKINGRGGLRFQTHQSWSQDAEMRREFKAGQAQRDFISRMQNELRKNIKAIHIRIWGEPGIGKTRLVLETIRAEDLQPLVIYCDAASKFIDSDLMNEILRDDNQFNLILIIDECDLDSRSYIWNKLKYRGPRIKLISIYNEYDETSGSINYLNAPPLDEEQISNIIQGYGIPKDQADRWVGFCSGSPRVAHVFGQNLKNNPEDLLKPPDTVNIWDRYVVGGGDPNSQQVQQRRLVLQHVALFKRFGYGSQVVDEAKAIAKIIEKVDPLLTWPKFQEIIQNLKTRKILQGENALYITPKALHIKLWTDWWNTYGEGFHFEEFSKILPDSLHEWFFEMFKYASESKVASRIVKELLGEKGPFKNSEYLKTELGARFFLALAEADPKSALECLKKTVGTWNKEELLQFTNGRREVIWALEKIAMWKDLFADSARLLLSLGEAENETWSNNASGVFAGLFSLAYGKVAPTEAPPQERFSILEEALESSSKERRILALNACNEALRTYGFSRIVGAEYQGLRKEPQLWMPKTYGELFDAYRKVWQLLCKQLDNLLEDEKQQAIDILLQNSRGLGMIQNLADMVIDTLEELSKKPYVDKKKVLAKIVQILHYDGKALPPQIRQRWEQLNDSLTGHDFSSLMRRYIGMDLLEDKFDEEGNQVDQTQPQIENLAQLAVENFDLLRPELDWIVTTEAQNGYRFGYELGKRDRDFSLLPMLLEAQRKAKEKASIFFLGGYFHSLFEKNQQKWERILDSLSTDEKLNIWVPELTWRSGMSNRAALRILNLAKRSIIGIEHFRMFGLGSVIRDLSEKVFKGWIEFLLNSSDTYAISIALDLYQFYYIRKESKYTLPEDLTLKLLTHPLLFQKPEKGRQWQMDEYDWTEIGKAFVQLYPEKSLELADKMLEHFGEDGTIFEGFHGKTQTVLNEITKLYPQPVWEKITKYLGPPMDSREFHIKEWLRGGVFFKEEEGAIILIPQEAIWRWVDEDVENRAWYLASFVPKRLFREEGRICLAREVLVRYGEREDVRRNLMANFSTEGWSGPASFHYQEKKQYLLDFKKDEDNENVKRWIDEYVSSLDRYIERAKIEEERRGYYI
jgi:hypothetical protein